jgi:hypothetical protein
MRRRTCGQGTGSANTIVTDQRFDTKSFPAFQRSVRAHWAPVLLAPIAGSYERFVIGVAVVGKDGFHLELANALERLHCLYSDDAHGAIYAVRLTAEQLRHDLSRRALDALTNPSPAISGVSIGQCREAEGESLQSIGSNWMRSLSSLYSQNIAPESLATIPIAESRTDGGSDRLPILVMAYVRERRQGYAKYFSRDLQEGRVRRLAGRSHEVFIDFSGSKIVANFGTLQAGGVSRSVGFIKRRLWDLKVERDREPNGIPVRQHEMLVQSPNRVLRFGDSG